MFTFRRPRKTILWAIAVACGLIVSCSIGMEWIEARQRLDITREWARLAPYPESARNLKATTTGNMFTRGFRVSFAADAAVIERWLQDSPGPRESTPERPEAGKRHFFIKPGGGAQWAEVTVDDILNLVQIRVYWS
jgi:hypothetical protein